MTYSQGFQHRCKRPPPKRPHRQYHIQLVLDKRQQGTATSDLHAANGTQDPRPSARETHHVREHWCDGETFQTDGPLTAARHQQAHKLCPGYNTHAAGATGLKPPLQSIRQHFTSDIGCGGTVHQYPLWRPPHYLPAFSGQWNRLQLPACWRSHSHHGSCSEV